MTVHAVQFDAVTRYCWKCPRCTYVSLSFKDEQRAATEQGVHWTCRGSRGAFLVPRLDSA